VRWNLLAQLGRPFRWGAGRLLIAVDGHEHGDPREKVPCPLDDVEMTGRDGVENARIDALATRPGPGCGQRKVNRLSRRGNRQASHASTWAAVTQIRQKHSEGRAYYDKKLTEGRPAEKPSAL
jgi:hypothetical protein